jgi:hypothetical protein
MSAARSVTLARLKNGMGNYYGSLARFQNRCSCHPREWGLKKGLRRARRRLDHEIVILTQHEDYAG